MFYYYYFIIIIIFNIIVITIIIINISIVITGVRVNRNGRDTDIAAKMVISDAGVANTFRNLLPRHVAEKTGKTC